ncbi:glycosyltransferase [Serinicoccus sp. LYQ131]|uniref:glycosyltransferase n=1 Tax=Serinicoccus sp. LYQ131 TaxID=3378797 RepID=UPI003852AFA0
MTARTAQTAQLLAEEPTHWVSPIAAREGGRALARIPEALRLIKLHRPDVVISTGAALAVPYLLASRLLGIRTHYIESATRLGGPSVTGRMMDRLPGMRLHHQGFQQPVTGWHAVSSVFDAYCPGPDIYRGLSRAFVTVGTEQFPFVRALDDVARSVPPSTEVLYQTGHTPVPAARASYRQWMPFDELVQALEQADVVVTHAGVGSILTALRAGKHPVVMPRLQRMGEHVDDHQTELAQMLELRGLVSVAWQGVELAPLLTSAASRTTIRVTSQSILL